MATRIIGVPNRAISSDTDASSARFLPRRGDAFERELLWIDGRQLIRAEQVDPGPTVRVDDDAVWQGVRRWDGDRIDLVAREREAANEVRRLCREPDVPVTVADERVRVADARRQLQLLDHDA